MLQNGHINCTRSAPGSFLARGSSGGLLRPSGGFLGSHRGRNKPPDGRNKPTTPERPRRTSGGPQKQTTGKVETTHGGDPLYEGESSPPRSSGAGVGAGRCTGSGAGVGCRKWCRSRCAPPPPHYPLPDFYPGPFLGGTWSFLGDPGLAPSGSSTLKANCAVSSREGKHESARSTVQHSAGAQVTKATSKCTRQVEPYRGVEKPTPASPQAGTDKKTKNIE